jgi:hypothetical protein
MKLPTFFGLRKKPNQSALVVPTTAAEPLRHQLKAFILLRRVVGPSMAPKLMPGQLVVATSLFRKLHPGQVVIIRRNNRELVKRIERIEKNKVFVIGDNLAASTDSRQFGWLDYRYVVALVIRPKLAK